MPLTVTGVAGSSINATTTAPDPLDPPSLKPLSSTAFKATLQSIVNDLATIAARRPTIFANAVDDNDTSTTYFTFDDSAAPDYVDGPVLDATGGLSGDVYHVVVSFLITGNFANIAAFRLDVVHGFGGGSPSTQAHVSGALARIMALANPTDQMPVIVQGYATADRAGTTRFTLVGKTFADDAVMTSAYTMTATRVRAY